MDEMERLKLLPEFYMSKEDETVRVIIAFVIEPAEFSFIQEFFSIEFASEIWDSHAGEDIKAMAIAEATFPDAEAISLLQELRKQSSFKLFIRGEKGIAGTYVTISEIREGSPNFMNEEEKDA